MVIGPLLEVCCGSVASALAAQEGGAHRVELCDNLYEGGTTPSFGTIGLARELLKIKLQVIIRPRGGDFLYSDLEYRIMKEDILRCKEAGVDGVVIGFLTTEGDVDFERVAEVVKLARPMSVTFHRAFDMTRDPVAALEVLKGLGVDRILTSGQQNQAPNGADLIRSLVSQAGDSLIIMPGGGLNEDNIHHFHQKVKALEYHATLRRRVESPMRFRREGVYMGGLPQIPEFSILETDPERVRRFVEQLEKECNNN
ncbi:MAG: copper homeostasis protein CutC [Bacteroidales bacterium]